MSRRRRCRRLHLSVSLSALVSLLGQASATGVTQTAAPVGALALVPLDDDADASERELYLEVVLNRVPSGQLARFVERDNGFLASAATLRGLGLRWPGTEAAAGGPLVEAALEPVDEDGSGEEQADEEREHSDSFGAGRGGARTGERHQVRRRPGGPARTERGTATG